MAEPITEASSPIREALLAALNAWFDRHERPGRSAFDRDVRGHGQVHPLWRGYSDEITYLHSTGDDGVRPAR